MSNVFIAWCCRDQPPGDDYNERRAMTLHSRGEKTRSHATDVPEELDAKDYVLRLAERSELLMGLPLVVQMRTVFEQLGFINVRVHHEQWHDFWLVRMDVGANTDCATETAA